MLDCACANNDSVLRILTEAKIKWGFLPPGSRPIGGAGDGIWIPGDPIGGDLKDEGDESDAEEARASDLSEEDEEEAGVSEEEEEVDGSAVSDEDESEDEVVLSGGRFGALSIDT